YVQTGSGNDTSKLYSWLILIAFWYATEIIITTFVIDITGYTQFQLDCRAAHERKVLILSGRNYLNSGDSNLPIELQILYDNGLMIIAFILMKFFAKKMNVGNLLTDLVKTFRNQTQPAVPQSENGIPAPQATPPFLNGLLSN